MNYRVSLEENKQLNELHGLLFTTFHFSIR